MIKFATAGKAGWVVGLGITVENLTRIAERLEPIVFPGEQVGLAGKFAIGTGGMGAALASMYPDVHCLELTQADADALTGGRFVERTLASLGYDRDGVALVFLGSTEAAILAELRKTGLVSSATQVTDPYAVKPMAVATPRQIKPGLILSGAMFVGLGALGVHIGKSPGLGVLIALGGIACIAWGFMYRAPQRR
jgi:hypothetical protein